jgi:C1A family cysteine protease
METLQAHHHRKHRYTRQKDKPDHRDHIYNAAAPQVMPAVVDLRPGCSPVEDQGNLGSCTTHAIAGALEYDEDVQKEQFLRLSRLFIYWNERNLEGDIAQDGGAQIRTGIKVIAKLGVPDETLWPYVEDQFTVKPSNEAFEDALKHKAISYARVMQTEHDLLHALAAGYPIIIGITIYDSFESDEVAKTGAVPMPNTATEQCLGGHAVLIVGYNRNTRVFTLRNSWSKDWGQDGYFTLPFEYILSAELAEDFWTISKIE